MKKATQKYEYVVGVDEVGRGPLAGPVTVCAFRIKVSDAKYISFSKQVRDSKQLHEKKRATQAIELAYLQKENKCQYAIVSVNAKIIDTKGIVYAITKALNTSLEKVGAQATDMILLDGGLYAPQKFSHQKTIIRGDEKELPIACASIVAKVHRDTYMKRIAKKYPQYGFESHVGYGTKRHREAIIKNGFTMLHRQSFCKNIKRQVGYISSDK